MNPTLSDRSNDKVSEEFHTVSAEAERLAPNASAGGDMAGVLRASVEKSLAGAADRLAKIREDSLNQIRTAARETDDYVHGNAWRVAGFFAVLGVLAGVLASVAIARRGARNHKGR